MKIIKLITIILLSITTSGCIASGGYRYYSSPYYVPYDPYYPNYTSNFGHRMREEILRQKIRRQQEAFEEYNLQEQFRENEKQLERLQIRNNIRGYN